MNKDNEWLKRRLTGLGNKPAQGNDCFSEGWFEAYEAFSDLVNQLDELEITEEQAWEVIGKFKNISATQASNVFKQGRTNIFGPELPVIPQFVASAIEKIKKNRNNITILNIFNEVTSSGFYTENVDDWILKNSDLFCQAWFSKEGYTIEKEPQWVVKIGKGYFSGYDELTVTYVLDNMIGELRERAVYTNLHEAETDADTIGGVVEVLTE